MEDGFVHIHHKWDRATSAFFRSLRCFSRKFLLFVMAPRRTADSSVSVFVSKTKLSIRIFTSYWKMSVAKSWRESDVKKKKTTKNILTEEEEILKTTVCPEPQQTRWGEPSADAGRQVGAGLHMLSSRVWEQLRLWPSSSRELFVSERSLAPGS